MVFFQTSSIHNNLHYTEKYGIYYEENTNLLIHHRFYRYIEFFAFYIYKVVAFVCVCVSVCTTLLQPTPLDRS